MADPATKVHSSDVAIRLVRADDGANGLWEVYAQLTAAPALAPERLAELIAELNADPYREIVVAVRTDGRVIGTASLVLERKLVRGGALCGHVEDVVVAEAARGLGLGKRLVRHLVDVARERGCYKVILDCEEDNVKFYERCGFARKEVQMALYFDE